MTKQKIKMKAAGALRTPHCAYLRVEASGDWRRGGGSFLKRFFTHDF
jgi:hypothetical protein